MMACGPFQILWINMDSPAPKNPSSHGISPMIHSAGGHVAAGLGQFRAGQCHYGAWEPGPAAVPLLGKFP